GNYGAEPRAHRFEQTDRGPLAERRHGEQRERAEQSRNVIVPAEEPDAVVDARSRSRRFQPFTLGTVARNHEHGTWSLLPPAEQPRERIDHRRVVLDRLEPTDAADDGRIRLDRQLRAHAVDIVRADDTVGVDTVHDYLDPTAAAH